MTGPQLNHQQREAVALGRQDGVRFIWGPPGTGKTLTVGHLAAVAATEGSRTLVVSYSNVAVDVATLAVSQAAPPELQAPGVVLRLGTPRKDEVRNHPTLTTAAVLRIIRPDLLEHLNRLQHAHALLTRQGTASRAELDRLRSDLRAIRAAIRLEEDRLTRAARIVNCTLARLATSSTMHEQAFDTVILDEASMASIPFAALAASHARRTVVYAGDFRQLPPIVMAETPTAERWLGRDVFDHAGVTEAARRAPMKDSRVVMLCTQYRMHPEIAHTISGVFYGGQLRTDDGVRERVSAITRDAPYSTFHRSRSRPAHSTRRRGLVNISERRCMTASGPCSSI